MGETLTERINKDVILPDEYLRVWFRDRRTTLCAKCFADNAIKRDSHGEFLLEYNHPIPRANVKACEACGRKAPSDAPDTKP